MSHARALTLHSLAGCANYGYDGNEDLCTDSKPQGMMAAIYFCSFIILSSMMILNLFIGVITTSMQEAKTALTEEMEAEEDLSPDDAMLKRLQRMSDDIDAMADEMQGWVPTQPLQTGTAGCSRCTWPPGLPH